MKVCLQLFAFDEPGVVDTMDAWSGDETSHDVDYWGCVTPHDGETVDAVGGHDTFELVETPEGKLSSRNVAHSMAVEEGFDVVAVTDADAPPLRDGALDSLLVPYGDGGVVATNGFPTEPTSLFGAIITIGERFEGVVRPHMNGQLSSFTTGSWESVGGFDESVDQTDVVEVRREEEFWFYRALSSVGEVKPAPGASVYNDPRRWKAKIRDMFGMSHGEYGSRRGVETFSGRNRPK